MRLALVTIAAFAGACEERVIIASDETQGKVSGGANNGGGNGFGLPAPSGDTETTGDVPPRLDLPAECTPPVWPSCDGASSDWVRALELDCPGGTTVHMTYTGHPSAVLTHDGKLGDSIAFKPRRGERFLMISTGDASEIRFPPALVPSCADGAICPSTAWDRTTEIGQLPPPLQVRPVDGRAVEPGLEIELVTCQDDPSLVGQGDCSNTLWIPWSQGKVAYDYTELRLSLDVPPDAYALRYDFAFLTAEYPTSPARADAGNDMFVAWLESEVWTGNISTDASGHPVAVRSVLLDYQASEELQGFAFEGHGATKWLTTAASVTPGESIELIFAVFDMGDAEVDSAVLLDNFHWGCFAGPPGTTPVK